MRLMSTDTWHTAEHYVIDCSVYELRWVIASHIVYLQRSESSHYTQSTASAIMPQLCLTRLQYNRSTSIHQHTQWMPALMPVTCLMLLWHRLSIDIQYLLRNNLHSTEFRPLLPLQCHGILWQLSELRFAVKFCKLQNFIVHRYLVKCWPFTAMCLAVIYIFACSHPT